MKPSKIITPDSLLCRVQSKWTLNRYSNIKSKSCKNIILVIIIFNCTKNSPFSLFLCQLSLSCQWQFLAILTMMKNTSLARKHWNSHSFGPSLQNGPGRLCPSTLTRTGFDQLFSNCPAEHARGAWHDEEDKQQAGQQEGAGHLGPPTRIAQEVAAVAELFALASHHVVLALDVEDLVLGGAAPSRHFSFWNI